MQSFERAIWGELSSLHVVRNVGRLLARRWGLGLGFVHADGANPPDFAAYGGENLCVLIQGRDSGLRSCEGSCVSLAERLSPDKSGAVKRTCHAGLVELAAPVLVGDELAASLVCGGFLRESEQARATATLNRKTDALELDMTLAAAARERVAVLTASEETFITDLMISAAEDIGVYLREHKRSAVHEGGTRDRFDSIVGASPPMQALYSLLDKVVASDSTILVQGENGTGKELVARAIHRLSSRKNQPFVVQNCSAFNDNLLDSELFGHKRGSFTGAVGDKLGLFEVADGGTFFLDEIGDMSPALQVKVLRVLQEGTFTPVGDTEEKRVDVRIVAATNRDLKAMVATGEFREDLYYRINVINLVIPPLRERGSDIELLARAFLDRHAGAGESKTLTSETIAKMRAYRWPGNVRELENEVERAVVLSGNRKVIEPTDVSERIQQAELSEAPGPDLDSLPLPAALRTLERRMILAALKRNGWNKTRAAAELEISRRNLIRLVQKYELESERPVRE